MSSDSRWEPVSQRPWPRGHRQTHRQASPSLRRWWPSIWAVEASCVWTDTAVRRLRRPNRAGHGSAHWRGSARADLRRGARLLQLHPRGGDLDTGFGRLAQFPRARSGVFRSRTANDRARFCARAQNPAYIAHPRYVAHTVCWLDLRRCVGRQGHIIEGRWHGDLPFLIGDCPCWTNTMFAPPLSIAFAARGSLHPSKHTQAGSPSSDIDSAASCNVFRSLLPSVSSPGPTAPRRSRICLTMSSRSCWDGSPIVRDVKPRPTLAGRWLTVRATRFVRCCD